MSECVIINECVSCCMKKTRLKQITGTWWQLNDYYGLNGLFCPKCFELVAHKDGVPVYQKEYNAILLMIALRKVATH